MGTKLHGNMGMSSVMAEMEMSHGRLMSKPRRTTHASSM